MYSILRSLLLGAALATSGAIAAAGCQHSPPADSAPAVVEPDNAETERAEPQEVSAQDAGQIDESEKAPQPAPPVTLEDAVVESIDEVEPPEVEPAPNGCVEHNVAQQHQRDVTRYHTYLAEVAAADKNWRRLADVMTLGPGSPLRRGSGFGNRVDFTKDRIIDDKGHHWMKVGSYSCGVPSPPATDYFIDADLKVFRLRADASSCKTKELDGCGVFPTYGCGREGPPNYHYVRVPNDAERVEDRYIGIDPGQCVVIEPVGGYGPPPP